MPTFDVAVECCKCGIVFGVAALWESDKRKTGDDFYCPNGHGLTYGKTWIKDMEAKLSHKSDQLAACCREVSALKVELADKKRKLSRKPKPKPKQIPATSSEGNAL